jgi:hypothetical protein
MKHVVTPIVLGTSLLIAPSLASAASMLNDAHLDAVSAGANVHLFPGATDARPAPGPGQPSQTIGSAVTGNATPGNAVNAPGSAFNPSGTAGGVYAGNGANNASNPKSVSQYDVAGFQLSHK